jgi:hypothetical protein
MINMWKFFKNHSEFVLIGLLVLFLAIIVAYSFWGITVLVTDLNQALSAGGKGPSAVSFDLKGAAGLDLKGLIK